MKVFNLLLALLLGACASVPVTRFYALVPASAPALVPASATKIQAPPTIVVREVTLPRYLDRPQIVTRTGEHRLRFAEYAHWGGDLREDITRVLAANLAPHLAGSAVLPAPTFVAVKPDLVVNVELLRFDAADDGQVHLVARWGVQGGLVREMALSRPRPGDAVDAALVGVMSELLGDLAAAIAPTLMAAKP